MTLLRKCCLFLILMFTFELFLIASLLFLIKSSEQAEEQIAYSNAVITSMNELLNLSREGAIKMVIGVFLDQSSSLAATKEECTKKLRSLNQLLSNTYATPLDKEEIGLAAKTCQHTIKEMDEALNMFRKGATRLEYLFMAERARQEFTAKMSLMISKTESFVRREIALRDASYAKQLTMKRFINGILVLAGTFNAIIAFVLVYGFSRNITDRLRVIQDNFQRFYQTRPLLSPAKGNDEISRLDRDFHAFANALEEAWQKDKAIFLNSPLSLIACTANGVIELCNPICLSTFRCSENDLVGRSVFSLDGSDSGNFQSYWQRASSAQATETAPIHYTCQFKRLDDSIFPAEFTFAHFEYQNEQKVLLALMDVTQRHALDEFRRRLVSMVSHDIKTPLTSMSVLMNNLETLIKSGEKKEALGKIETVTVEFSRLYRLTCDLLDMARLKSARIEANEELVTLSSVINAACNAVIWLARERQIELVQQIPEAQMSIKTDPDRLTQILVNLLSNAIKFSPPASTIVLGAHTKAAQTTIFVQDSGRGISGDQLQTIFEPFRQLETEDRQSGSGLGLAICKMLAESLGATMEVTSTIGKGSVFSVVLS